MSRDLRFADQPIGEIHASLSICFVSRARVIGEHFILSLSFYASTARVFNAPSVFFQSIHRVMSFTEAELAQPASQRYDIMRFSHQIVPGSPYYEERVEKCQDEMYDIFHFIYSKFAHITGKDLDEVYDEMESPPSRRRRQRRRARKSSTFEKSGAVSETSGKASGQAPGNAPANAPANAPVNTSKTPGKASGETSGKVSNAPGNTPGKILGKTSGQPFAPKMGQQEQQTQGNMSGGIVRKLQLREKVPIV
jgi:hypothetical protein